MYAQMAIGCGTIYAFYVGVTTGESVESPGSRWEFFIGDHPNTVNSGAIHCRQPMEQIQSIEAYLEAGDVGLSNEVLNQVCPLIFVELVILSV